MLRSCAYTLSASTMTMLSIQLPFISSSGPNYSNNGPIAFRSNAVGSRNGAIPYPSSRKVNDGIHVQVRHGVSWAIDMLSDE